MGKNPWYNTTICTKLNGQIFEDYFKTGRKDRYYLMFSVDTYGKQHVPMANHESNGGGIPMPITSYKYNFSNLITLSTFLTIRFNDLR